MFCNVFLVFSRCFCKCFRSIFQVFYLPLDVVFDRPISLTYQPRFISHGIVFFFHNKTVSIDLSAVKTISETARCFKSRSDVRTKRRAWESGGAQAVPARSLAVQEMSGSTLAETYWAERVRGAGDGVQSASIRTSEKKKREYRWQVG